MKVMQRYIPWVLAAATVLATSGCWAHAQFTPGASGYVVYEAPPAPRVVVRPAEPYAGAIWVAGHWQWTGAQWAWVEGYWEQPRVGYVYVQPRWARQGRGWVYVGGGWRASGGRVYVQPHQRQYRGNVEVRPARPAVEVRGRARGTVEVR